MIKEMAMAYYLSMRKKIHKQNKIKYVLFKSERGQTLRGGKNIIE